MWNDDTFWEQLWSPDNIHSVNDVFAMIPADDIRKLREDSPKNLATLCYKTLEKLQHARDHPNECGKKVINCDRLLTSYIAPDMLKMRSGEAITGLRYLPEIAGRGQWASCTSGILGDISYFVQDSLLEASREPLVEVALQVLIVCLDKDNQPQADETGYSDNYFINYLGRIHREEDFDFMLKGMTRLLSNPLQSTYLPNSAKKINFHQELLVLLWKCCEYNQKFMFYVLKTSDVLEILVPILYHITESRNDPTRVGLIHMGVFLVLLLSGERNFGVRLNKPYIAKAAIDIQAFTGTHADLLIIVRFWFSTS
ncbi:hypothetical protein OSTOST_04438 [Ostertagia ostertagi]